MKNLTYFFIFAFLISCAKQELKLPLLQANNATKEVYNNSAVWIFYSVKEKDTIAQLNQGNRIETTNWLFNIDRRLTLKQIYAPFKKLLEKRQKASPHHVDGLLNYFSFADTLSHKVAFLPFNFKEIAYNYPLVSDTTSLNFTFYKQHFAFKNSLFLYSQLDSVMAKNLDKPSSYVNLDCYFQENLGFEKYLSIKAKWIESPYQKHLTSTTEYYFK